MKTARNMTSMGLLPERLRSLPKQNGTCASGLLAAAPSLAAMPQTSMRVGVTSYGFMATLVTTILVFTST